MDIALGELGHEFLAGMFDASAAAGTTSINPSGAAFGKRP
jgi:hypothetical protein